MGVNFKSMYLLVGFSSEIKNTMLKRHETCSSKEPSSEIQHKVKMKVNSAYEPVAHHAQAYPGD